MPEGDVVWAAAKRLHAALAGRVLTRSEFRVPRYATTDLTGRSVIEVVSRGKHLLIRVEGDVTVHTHLRMEGAWRIRPAGAPPPRDHRLRLVLANAEWQALGFSLGVVEVVRTSREDRVVGHLGPDLLGPDWDPAEAVRRLRERPERAVGEALLDQTRLAGIGNLYKAEVLFLRGVDPWCPVGEVPGIEALVELARRLIDANKDHLDQITTGARRPGAQTWVYGRAGRPCRRCGTPIRRADQGDRPEERVTFWCPSCQSRRSPPP
ncbi:DNA glycosylase [Actinoallomurus purpureus]|uniref:DNA-formamidopyrimidine glycosylase family protein n=1 Tax=Actinoallomurus purpureus TaxID=478114 RepID=UPI0020938E22|nr:DNA-formamidopyrimidine glycosylase family protein [Actinoallomurus purpureus]MCO6006407.1 DNA glycosylase [Actinoallomurus purpureus]